MQPTNLPMKQQDIDTMSTTAQYGDNTDYRMDEDLRTQISKNQQQPHPPLHHSGSLSMDKYNLPRVDRVDDSISKIVEWLETCKIKNLPMNQQDIDTWSTTTQYGDNTNKRIQPSKTIVPSDDCGVAKDLRTQISKNQQEQHPPLHHPEGLSEDKHGLPQGEESPPTIVEWLETCETIYHYINDKIIHHYTAIHDSHFVLYDENDESLPGDIIKSQLLHRMQFNADYEKSLLLKIMNNHPSMIQLFSENRCTFKDKIIEIDSWKTGINDTFASPAIKDMLLSMVKDILTEDTRTFSNPSIIIFQTILELYNKAIIDAC